MTDLPIQQLSQFPDAEWDAYVVAHPQARFFHLSAWGEVYRAIGYLEPCFIYARKAGRICGVLPMARVSGLFGAGLLLASPFCVLGGALADGEAVENALEEKALSLGAEQGCRQLELRGLDNNKGADACDRSYAYFSRRISRSDEENIKQVPRKQRAMIRKGESAGLEFDTDIELSEFDALYSRSMRDLGTPRYAPQLFESLLDSFGGRTSIAGVRESGNLVAAVMSFRFRECIMPYYAGAVPRARALKAYDFIYWRVMQEAARTGCTEFDFGRSLVGSGAYAFKKNWGFEPQPMVYRHIAINNAPIKRVDPENGFNRLARRVWSRLPLGVANRLGPLVARRLT